MYSRRFLADGELPSGGSRRRVPAARSRAAAELLTLRCNVQALSPRRDLRARPIQPRTAPPPLTGLLSHDGSGLSRPSRRAALGTPPKVNSSLTVRPSVCMAACSTAAPDDVAGHPCVRQLSEVR